MTTPTPSPCSPLTRRRFLGGLGAGSALPLAAWAGHRTRSLSAPRRVVVIGAGIAGLTAARALSWMGIEVVVLDGLSRVGGRVDTHDLGGTPMDDGAAWVHGASVNNPVAQYFSSIGVQLLPDNVPYHVFEQGTGFLSRWQVRVLNRRVKRFIATLPNLRTHLGLGASLEQGIDLFVHQQGFSGTARARTRFILQTFFESWYAGSTRDLSLEWIWTDFSYPGVDAFPSGGFKQLPETLAQGLDVRLNTTVVAVDHSSTGVEVHTSTDVFRGDHAIVTVPLGVLKAGSIRFTPGLPQQKLDAIGRLGMGAYEKILLKFDYPFWSGIDDLSYSSSLEGEYPFFKDLTPFSGTPSLVAIAAGSFAEGMQSMSSSVIVAQVLDVLEEITGVKPPMPVESHVTGWRSKPLFRGSYSFLPTGSSPDDQFNLGEPTGRVLFAGEATCQNYYATAHGAMLTGLREASRLTGVDLNVGHLR